MNKDYLRFVLKMLARSNRQLKQRLRQAQRAYLQLQVNVSKQPQTPAEVALCQEQMDACPVESIGKNG